MCLFSFLANFPLLNSTQLRTCSVVWWYSSYLQAGLLDFFHRACPGLTHPQGLSIRGRCWQFSPDHGNARSRYSNAAPADIRLFKWREQSQMERPVRASFTKGNTAITTISSRLHTAFQNTYSHTGDSLVWGYGGAGFICIHWRKMWLHVAKLSTTKTHYYCYYYCQ